MLLRLDKILSSTNEAGRRDIKAAIRAGRVTVDGVPALSAKEKFDPGRRIELDGVPVCYKQYRYLMLNKPAGYISATTDKREKTVLELLPEQYRAGMFPAGRLDKDAEGLLLMTNDGDTAHALTSPRRHVDKLYLVHVAGALDASDMAAFTAGILLYGEDAPCMPANLEIIESGTESLCYVTLREGKYHQIKRMFQSLGKTVVYLKRLRIGPLTLDSTLPPGGFRELTDAEEQSILNIRGAIT